MFERSGMEGWLGGGGKDSECRVKRQRVGTAMPDLSGLARNVF